jgi:hypothetical protein
MLTRISNRQLVLVLLAVALDLLFVGLGSTIAAAGLTALFVGVPVVYLVGLARETMESYGLSASETGPSRPPRILDSPPSGAPTEAGMARPTLSRRRPDIAIPVNRAAILLLITSTVMTLHSVGAL